MLYVMKFGGSSVADIECMRRVASRIAKTKNEGNDVVVVVSAMGDTTDEIIDLAHQLNPNPREREMDMLLATGEMQSSALLAMTLQAMNVDAAAFTGMQAGFRTTGVHTKAKILGIETERIEKEIGEGRVVIVAGFQGVSDSRDFTTLGRGGSDTTAVALAAALKADVCEIFTDVDGVYSADPRVCPKARKLSTIAYDEMLEMASTGARVMQARSIEFGKKYGVKIHVRSSFNENPGTIIQEEGVNEMEGVVISAVTHNVDEAKITVKDVPDKPGEAAQIFTALGEANINIDMIVQSATSGKTNDISFTVPRADLSKALKVVEATAEKIGAGEVAHDSTMGKVSIIGVGMVTHTGVAATMFRTLADEKINIEMISTSEIKISCVINEDDVPKAVRVLHTAFGLDKDE